MFRRAQGREGERGKIRNILLKWLERVSPFLFSLHSWDASCHGYNWVMVNVIIALIGYVHVGRWHMCSSAG